MKPLGALVLVVALLAVPGPWPATAAGVCQGLSTTHEGTPGGTVTGTPGIDVIVTGGASLVDAGGGSDLICITGSVGVNDPIVVLGGAGKDRVQVFEHTIRDVASIDGGEGRDRLIVTGERRDPDPRFVEVDLAKAKVVLTDADPAYTFTVTGIEDAEIADFPRSHLYGDPGKNSLVVTAAKAENLKGNACRIIVSGRGNDDSVKVTGALHGNCPQPRLSGNGGDDKLFGSAMGDLIFGGPGADYALGGQGRDLCRAELVKSCEGRPS